MRALAAVLLAIAPLGALDAQGAESKYDRFKDRTEVSASKPGAKTDGAFNLLWMAIYPGQTLVARPPARLVVMTSAKEWQYLRCHDLSLLADGKPVPVADTKHSGQVGRGYVLESVFAELPEATIDKLAAAASVEMRLCRTEYQFDPDDMRVLREFVTATTPQK